MKVKQSIMTLVNIDSSHLFYFILVEHSKCSWLISCPTMMMITVVFSGRHRHRVIGTLNATELNVIPVQDGVNDICHD
jgi:hypothetical protein